MAFINEVSQRLPGATSGNHGKQNSGWPEQDSNPRPAECESSITSSSKWKTQNSAGAQYKECQKRDYGSSSIVCVCNETYCDTVQSIKPALVSNGNYLMYVSSTAGLRLHPQEGKFSSATIIHHIDRFSVKFEFHRFWGRGGTVVRILASHQGKPGKFIGGDAPKFSHVVILPDNAASQRVFSGISHIPQRCIPPLLHTHFASPSLAIKNSMFRGVQTSSLTSLTHRCLYNLSSRIFTMEPSTTYQEMLGFGAALTDSVAYNLYTLSEKAREMVLQ
ncbi:hypothetical protein PR048_032816 [Dryococelus australis]|uniref:Glucosylceramidase n=1 Tax=Dryococelus australis TaxID=614101 RepID=A0ABQ9G7E1_9NEOP|nr:hypothetical protein PR048_032816 [Dryococelus australis]